MIKPQMKAGTFSFLVTGAGRGGTSLMAGLLGSHPELAIGFERHASYLLGETPDHVGTVAGRISQFRCACDAEARESAKPWGNKITTEQIAGLEAVRASDEDSAASFFSALADVRLIFILRDGRACVRSKVNRTGQPLELACQRWKRSVEIYRWFVEGKIRGVSVKFEEVLADPRAALEPVCGHLAVPFREEMLHGTDHCGMSREYRQPGLDQSKAEAGSLPDAAMSLLEDDLRFCGYI